MSLEITLFLDFLNFFCEDVSCRKLRVKKIVFFGPMDQKLWVFEVSRRSLGRVGMCWSQLARVDHLHKKWRAKRKKNSRKMGIVLQVQASIRGRQATVGRCSALDQHLCLWDNSHFFEIFLLKKKIFWKFGRWARAFRRMGVQHP